MLWPLLSQMNQSSVLGLPRGQEHWGTGWCLNPLRLWTDPLKSNAKESWHFRHKVGSTVPNTFPGYLLC